MEEDGEHAKLWYILPICPDHNEPNGKYDWGGEVMSTEDDAWAVEIPAVKL